MRKKLIALLPMKANSERVVGKNFRSLAGKPLFQWMLDTLLAVDEITEVVINTDARAQLLNAGLRESDRVVIRDRPAELCGDLVSMNLIIEDDIKNTSGAEYLMTHTTNPLLSGATVLDAIRTFRSRIAECDSLFSVNRIQTRFYRQDGSAVNHDPDELVRTQDLEPWFEENSCLYVFTPESFGKTGARIGESPAMFETPALESVDIDEPDDWTMAEALLLHRQRS